MSDCSCGVRKDQTHKNAAEIIKKKGERGFDCFAPLLAVSLFRVPASELGVLEYRSVYSDNISYEECAKRGHDCEAFQWLPNGYVLELGGARTALTSGEQILIDPPGAASATVTGEPGTAAKAAFAAACAAACRATRRIETRRQGPVSTLSRLPEGL